jgi:hypothetical protein
MMLHSKLATAFFGYAFAVLAGAAADAASRDGSKMPPTAAESPACAVSMVPSEDRMLRVNVAGRPLVLTPFDNDSPEALRVYPDGPDAVLVAYVGHTQNTPYGSATLWRVACASGAAEIFAHMEAADFGHAALSADRKTLFFSGPDGVFALDLASRQSRRLTTAASVQCLKADFSAVDVVVGLDRNGAVEFERGCGYEYQWHAIAMVLHDPGLPGMRVASKPSPPRPVAVAVAIGAGGWIWLADGRCGDRTMGRVTVSSDGGQHWRAIQIKMLVPQPVQYLIGDAERPGSALVFTASCGSDAHVDPAWIYLTEDGGNSFSPIAVPPGIAADDQGRPASEQDPIQAVVAPDGTFSQLILYGESTKVLGNQVGHWMSHDHGRTWEVLPPVAAPPQLNPAEAALPASGNGVSIRKDGVYLWQKRGETGVRIYPRVD